MDKEQAKRVLGELMADGFEARVGTGVDVRGKQQAPTWLKNVEIVDGDEGEFFVFLEYKDKIIDGSVVREQYRVRVTRARGL